MRTLMIQADIRGCDFREASRMTTVPYCSSLYRPREQCIFAVLSSEQYRPLVRCNRIADIYGVAENDLIGDFHRPM